MSSRKRMQQWTPQLRCRVRDMSGSWCWLWVCLWKRLQSRSIRMWTSVYSRYVKKAYFSWIHQIKLFCKLPGCVRGQCIQPNKCLCDFGYVGANCSIQCQCNGHANCEGPDKLDKCLECHNNTMVKLTFKKGDWSIINLFFRAPNVKNANLYS